MSCIFPFMNRIKHSTLPVLYTPHTMARRIVTELGYLKPGMSRERASSAMRAFSSYRMQVRKKNIKVDFYVIVRKSISMGGLPYTEPLQWALLIRIPASAGYLDTVPQKSRFFNNFACTLLIFWPTMNRNSTFGCSTGVQSIKQTSLRNRRHDERWRWSGITCAIHSNTNAQKLQDRRLWTSWGKFLKVENHSGMSASTQYNTVRS